MLILILVACQPNGSVDCDEPIQAFVDDDGDGYGSGEPQPACGLGPGLADNRVDCDDQDPDVFVGADEVCNGIDDDCDGEVDEDFDPRTFFADEDGDGFGARFPAVLTCSDPGPGWAPVDTDCDDGDPTIHPDAIEVCNDGVDDDCDALADDADASLDLRSVEWFLDFDGDGLGDLEHPSPTCIPPDQFVNNSDDCDDSDPSITQFPFFEDADLDGYGAAGTEVLSCPGFPGGSDNDLDCDDTDPLVNVPKDWYADADGDAWGSGPSQGFTCLPPGPDLGPFDGDCDDTDPTVYPGATEVCDDGIDQSCTGGDLPCEPATCKVIHDAAPGEPSGVYTLYPSGMATDLYCDMDTDGGGWTLVASTEGTTLDDAAGGWHADLLTLSPTGAHAKVFSGLRDELTGPADVRFACKNQSGNAQMKVDLSFYQVPWYREFSKGTDTDSCFSESNGAGEDPPPMRRDNVTGDVRQAGNPWNAGYLEGEDSCGDNSDFTVDFDDRGMDSIQDSTDWGEDDGIKKCGTSNPNNGAWFIFVR